MRQGETRESSSGESATKIDVGRVQEHGRRGRREGTVPKIRRHSKGVKCRGGTEDILSESSGYHKESY